MGVIRDAERDEPRVVEGLQARARRDERGRAVAVDAIDEDVGKIRALADRLQRVGYGVMRQKTPRAGRIFYRLRATWAGPGEPPEDPFEGEPSADAAPGGDGPRRDS